LKRDRGAVAIVLHSHMPYVEGFGTWPFGEEWLWEAVATVYLPLAELLQEEHAPITLGLTPVLCDQLELLPGAAGERLLAFLRETRRAVHEEDSSALERSGQSELAAEVRRAADDYERALEALETGGRELIDALARASSHAPLELWASPATHPVLPLLASDAGLRLQLATGVAAHERRFGGFGGGMWLPECAYAPGLDRYLTDHGVSAVCVDQTAVHGYGAPEQLEPVLTAAGIVALPIDWATVALVWSERSGYPAHGTYRDYHRGTAYNVHPWSNSGGPYLPAEAAALARSHAIDFVERCLARLDGYREERGRPGLVCFALDTELLGHWWYEGQTWLREVLREAPARGLELVTVSEGIERIDPIERELAASSWGMGRDLTTWDSPQVAEMAFAARRAELRTVAAATQARAGDPAGRAALERGARELLALQSSDWAFQVTRELAGEYPAERVAGHLDAHDAALGALADCGLVPSAPPPVEPALRGLAPDLQLASLPAP